MSCSFYFTRILPTHTHIKSLNNRSSTSWLLKSVIDVVNARPDQETNSASRSYSTYTVNLCTYQCNAGGGVGRAWCGDLIVFVVPRVGHLTDLVLPGEGIFESFFARRGDIWLPTRTKKTETEHMFPPSTLHACAIRFEKIRKSWRPMKTSEGWVDFTVLSSNFVCFNVFLINWTS